MSREEGNRKRKGGDFIERTGGIAVSTTTLSSVPTAESLDFDLPSRRSIKRDFFTRQSPRTWSAEPTKNNIFFLCPDIACQPLHCLVGDDEGDTTAPTSQPPRFGLQKPGIFQADRESTELSPTSILSDSRGRDPNSVFFWRRSMAWQDSWTSDDDDESEGRYSHSQSILRENLSVPVMQHQDLATAQQIHLETSSPDSRPPRPNVRRPRCLVYPNHGVSAIDISGIPRTQKSTSEIYWEEQVSDSLDLEKLAKLSLS
jgi:hypothetical protein